MNIRAILEKARLVASPPKQLEIRIIRSLDEITDIDAAIWVLFTI